MPASDLDEVVEQYHLAAGDFLRADVARRPSLSDCLHEQPAFLLECFAPIELRAQRVQSAAPPHRLAQLAGTLAQQLQVVHQLVGIESGTTER